MDDILQILHSTLEHELSQVTLQVTFRPSVSDWGFGGVLLVLRLQAPRAEQLPTSLAL